MAISAVVRAEPSPESSVKCRSRPAQPRHHAPPRLRAHLAFSALAAVAFLSAGPAFAQQDPVEAAIITAPARLDASTTTELLLDEAAAPSMAAHFEPELLWGDHEILKRGSDDDGGDSSSSDDKTASDEESSATPSSTIPTSMTVASTSAAATSPLPSPFDTSRASDFKSPGEDDSCPTFISSLLASASFKSCYPISMMMKLSNSFFDAEQHLLSIVRVLDASCSAKSSYCTDYLNEAAHNLTQPENCQQEYKDGQRLVSAAYTGLRAYEMMYSATCLQDPDDDMYCFASAVTNDNHPSDFNLYFMPYGFGLPGGSSPSCDWCTKQTMGIFHAAASDRGLLIADVYVNASRQVNTLCGPSFVNETLPEAVSGAAPFAAPSQFMAFAVVGVTALLHAAL